MSSVSLPPSVMEEYVLGQWSVELQFFFPSILFVLRIMCMVLWRSSVWLTSHLILFPLSELFLYHGLSTTDTHRVCTLWCLFCEFVELYCHILCMSECLCFLLAVVAVLIPRCVALLCSDYSCAMGFTVPESIRCFNPAQNDRLRTAQPVARLTGTNWKGMFVSGLDLECVYGRECVHAKPAVASSSVSRHVLYWLHTITMFYSSLYLCASLRRISLCLCLVSVCICLCLSLSLVVSVFLCLFLFVSVCICLSSLHHASSSSTAGCWVQHVLPPQPQNPKNFISVVPTWNQNYEPKTHGLGIYMSYRTREGVDK